MPEKSSTTQQKTKELKTFSAQIITQDHIKKDKRKLSLLNIIKTCDEISEKGLIYLIAMLKDEKGLNIGYTILKMGTRVIIRELQEDIRALLYTSLIEVNPKNKKLRLTSIGNEFLDKVSPSEVVENLESILKAVEELKPKILPLDEEVALIASSPTKR
ncbi:MAG: hypothetical protein QW775_06975, partial [Ignisphaera sp.]|uniref:Uncharacterized protein n=1 Tax=Ignisphaera aggregans TaxID=334771 RepID=A0A7C4NM93_9CREN